nr:MAG TPA: hypothetical protein [Caudoviricetes sp.]
MYIYYILIYILINTVYIDNIKGSPCGLSFLLDKIRHMEE